MNYIFPPYQWPAAAVKTTLWPKHQRSRVLGLAYEGTTTLSSDNLCGFPASIFITGGCILVCCLPLTKQQSYWQSIISTLATQWWVSSQMNVKGRSRRLGFHKLFLLSLWHIDSFISNSNQLQEALLYLTSHLYLLFPLPSGYFTWCGICVTYHFVDSASHRNVGEAKGVRADVKMMIVSVLWCVSSAFSPPWNFPVQNSHGDLDSYPPHGCSPASPVSYCRHNGLTGDENKRIQSCLCHVLTYVWSQRWWGSLSSSGPSELSTFKLQSPLRGHCSQHNVWGHACRAHCADHTVACGLHGLRCCSVATDTNSHLTDSGAWLLLCGNLRPQLFVQRDVYEACFLSSRCFADTQQNSPRKFAKLSMQQGNMPTMSIGAKIACQQLVNTSENAS